MAHLFDMRTFPVACRYCIKKCLLCVDVSNLNAQYMPHKESMMTDGWPSTVKRISIPVLGFGNGLVGVLLG